MITMHDTCHGVAGRGSRKVLTRGASRGEIANGLSQGLKWHS